MYEPKYLVMVSPGANNNKYYRMTVNEAGTEFTAEYGRVGTSPQTKTYPISRWDSTYKSKLRKGYSDNSEFYQIKKTVGKASSFADVSDSAVKEIIRRLQEYADSALQSNYTVNSEKVTQKMIDWAQELIYALPLKKTVSEFNFVLTKVFTTIPRVMGDVDWYTAKSEADFPRIVQREQDLLDVMKGKVSTSVITEDIDESKTVLETLGIDIKKCSGADIDVVTSNLRSLSDKFYDAYIVTNKKTQEKYDNFVKSENISDEKLLWHGSRNENWWSIMNSGLVLRPNAVITGKMFGKGIYYAPKATKSFGYTSYSGSRWARGNEACAFMGLYSVAYGSPLDLYRHEYWCGDLDYNELQRRQQGANSVHAHAGQSLVNDEIIIYKEDQCTIKYLVELR